MSVEEALLEELRVLPPDKQQQLLSFAKFLHQEAGSVLKPQQSLFYYGMCADLGPGPTEAEIDQARVEAWSNFPDEDI